MPEPTARDLLTDLTARRVSARELLDAAVARADATSVHNAVVARDVDGARAAATRIDDARIAGTDVGRLAGLPMTIKDGFDVAGLPAVSGNPALADRDARVADAGVVAAVRAAGAVPWAKTNVPLMLGDVQTFNAVYGTTTNPFDPSRTPGGSSGGAAVALATGVTSLEIGTDLGGSLRTPAGFCGVHALKPTWGALPLTGNVPPLPGAPPSEFGDDLAVAGPMARTAGDLRLLWEVLAGVPTTPAPTAGLRVALWLDAPGSPLAAEVRAVLERAAGALAAQGVHVEAAAPPVDVDELVDTYFTLLFPAVAAGLPPKVRDRLARGRADAVAAGGSRYSPEANVAFLTGGAEEIVAARGRRARMQRIVAAWFAGFDAVLAPVTPVAAFPHDQAGGPATRTLDVGGQQVPYLHLFDHPALATLLHLPAVAAPAGRTRNGLPVGAQLIAPMRREDRLLDLAEALEEAVGTLPGPPPPR